MSEDEVNRGTESGPDAASGGNHAERGTPVRVERAGEHVFTARNTQGAEVRVGQVATHDTFTPGELLLAAIAGCSAVTSENLVVRRVGEDAALTVDADRDKDPADPHRFSDVRVELSAALESIADEAERAKTVDALTRAINKYCTVSRSVTEGTPIHLDVARTNDQ